MGQQLGNLVENIYEQSNKKKITVLPYNLQYVSKNQLNHGLFCRSFLTELQNNRLFVTKIIKRPKFNIRGQLALLDYYKQKISKMTHVIPYISYHADNDNIFLIRPYIYNTVQQCQQLQQSYKDYIAIQMIQCVQELHNEKLIHGNIVLSNFVITDSGKVYLCDYCPYKPGYFDYSDSQYLIYFDQTVKDPARICELQQRNFVMCKQETDVFELGITLLNLYNEKQCFSKQSFVNITSQQELDDLIQPYYQEVKNNQILSVIKQMMQLQLESRIQLSNIDISSLYDDKRVYYLNKRIYQYTNGCPDNDIRIMQMVINSIKNTKDILKCLQCHLKQKIDTSNSVISSSIHTINCDQNHNFPATLASGKQIFVENASYNQLMLIILQRCVSQLSKQQFIYQDSKTQAITIVKDIFEILGPDYEDAGLTIMLQLLQVNILTEFAELFLHVFNTISKLNENKYFLPLLIYCKYFLPISNFISATQQLIKYMKSEESKIQATDSQPHILKNVFTFDIFYSSITMINHTRIFAAFTETVFRLLYQHKKQFVDVFEHSFCRASNSSLDQFTYCIGQVHSKESLQEILLFNIFLGIPSILQFAPSIVDLFIQKAQGFPKFLAGICRAIQFSRLTQEQLQNTQIQEQTYEQGIIQNMITALINTENVQKFDQSLYLMAKSQQNILEHHLLTPKKLLITYMNYVTNMLSVKILQHDFANGTLVHTYRQCYLHFFPFLVQLNYRQRRDKNFIIYINENFQSQLIQKFLTQINSILKTNIAFCQQSSNILENKLYIKCFLDQMTKLQQLTLQNVITYVSFISSNLDINIQASIQNQAFIITYMPHILTPNILQNPAQLHMFLLNLFVAHQLFLHKLEVVIGMTQQFAAFNINDYVYQLFSDCKQISWKESKANLKNQVIQNMGYEINSVNEIYSQKIILNQCLELQRVDVKTLQKQFLSANFPNITQQNYIQLFGTQNRQLLYDTYSSIISTYNFSKASHNIESTNQLEQHVLFQYLSQNDQHVYQNSQLFADVLEVINNIKNTQMQLQQLKDKYQQDTRNTFDKKMRYQQQKQLIINQPMLFNLQEQIILTDVEHLVQQHLINISIDKQHQKLRLQESGSLYDSKYKPDQSKMQIPQAREVYELCQKENGIRQVQLYKEQYIVILDTQDNIKIFNLHPYAHLNYLRKQEKITRKKLVANNSIDIAYNNLENILQGAQNQRTELQPGNTQTIQDKNTNKIETNLQNQSILDSMQIQDQNITDDVSQVSITQGDSMISIQSNEKQTKGKVKVPQTGINMVNYLFLCNQYDRGNQFNFYEKNQSQVDLSVQIQKNSNYLTGKQEMLSVNLGVKIRQFSIDNSNILTIITADDQLLRYEIDMNFLSMSVARTDGTNLIIGDRQKLVLEFDADRKKEWFLMPHHHLTRIYSLIGRLCTLENEAANQNEQLVAISPAQNPINRAAASSAARGDGATSLGTSIGHSGGFIDTKVALMANVAPRHRILHFICGFKIPGLLGFVPNHQNQTFAVISKSQILFCASNGAIFGSKQFRNQICDYKIASPDRVLLFFPRHVSELRLDVFPVQVTALLQYNCGENVPECSEINDSVNNKDNVINNGNNEGNDVVGKMITLNYLPGSYVWTGIGLNGLITAYAVATGVQMSSDDPIIAILGNDRENGNSRETLNVSQNSVLSVCNNQNIIYLLCNGVELLKIILESPETKQITFVKILNENLAIGFDSGEILLLEFDSTELKSKIKRSGKGDRFMKSDKNTKQPPTREKIFAVSSDPGNSGQLSSLKSVPTLKLASGTKQSPGTKIGSTPQLTLHSNSFATPQSLATSKVALGSKSPAQVALEDQKSIRNINVAELLRISVYHLEESGVSFQSYMGGHQVLNTQASNKEIQRQQGVNSQLHTQTHDILNCKLQFDQKTRLLRVVSGTQKQTLTQPQTLNQGLLQDQKQQLQPSKFIPSQFPQLSFNKPHKTKIAAINAAGGALITVDVSGKTVFWF